MKIVSVAAMLIAVAQLTWAQQDGPKESTTATVTSNTAAPKAAKTDAMPLSPDGLTGVAAYYSNKFQGRRTVSGQRYNKNAMTAAHPNLPMGTRVKVTNLKNKRSAVVVVNDRLSASSGRIIDVTHRAAIKLGLLRTGIADVKLEVLGHGKIKRNKVAHSRR